MDEREWVSSKEYMITPTHKDVLVNTAEIDFGESDRGEEILNRARNLDTRVEYLLEDLLLLRESGALDEIQGELKVRLDEVDCFLEEVEDVDRLRSEIRNPDGLNVSEFGLAMGLILSELYPGDSTEQARLWWGLSLGYFGHPTMKTSRAFRRSRKFSVERSSPSQGVGKSVLPAVARQFQSKEDSDLGLMSDARELANSTFVMFGQELSVSNPENEEWCNISELPLRAQAIVVSMERHERTRYGLEGVYFRFLKETGMEIDEVVLSGGDADSIVDVHDWVQGRQVDFEKLNRIDDAVGDVQTDLLRIQSQYKPRVTAEQVLYYLQTSDMKTSSAIGDKIGRSANNVGYLLNEFADWGENRSDKEWCFQTPASRDGQEVELNTYGQLLAHLIFDTGNPLSELYIQAFPSSVRRDFDVPKKVDEWVEELLGY